MSHSFANTTASLAMLLLISQGSHATSTDLEEILVKERHIEETLPLDLSRYGSRVEIITADMIEEHGFVDIAQTVQRLVPGLFLSPKNGPFDYFTCSLQGSRCEDILWLVDGVRITNRLYNTTTPLDTVPAHMVERIEVLKGGQGLYYGTQSVGGVINIVTKSFTHEQRGAVEIGGDTNSSYNVNGFYSNSVDDHQFVLYSSRDESDGFQPFRDEHYQPSSTDRDRGYDVNNVGIKYAYSLSDALRLSAHYQRTENEVDFAEVALASEAFNERTEDQFTVKLDYLHSDNLAVFIKGYYHSWDSFYTESHHDLVNPGQFIVIDDESFWGYEDYGVNAMARFSFHTGFEYVLGYDYQSFSGRDDVLLIADQAESVNAVFFQARTTADLFENTLFAAGIRYNEQSDAGGTTIWNLTGVHNFTDNLFIRGNTGTAFRLPDAWQLFGNDPCCARGNPALEPEESFNANIGIGGRMETIGAGLNWELIGFYRTVDGLIGSLKGMRVNSQREVEMAGAEIVLDLDLTPAWSAMLDYVYTSAEEKGSSFQIADIPTQTFKFTLGYQPQTLPLGLSLSVLHTGDVFSDAGGFFTTGNLIEHGNYTVLDLSGHYYLGTGRNHRVGFRLENLLDEDYATRIETSQLDSNGQDFLYDHLGVPRTFHLSYSYSF